MNMNFKHYILTEGHDYLASRVGDILNSIHELLQAGKQVGTRQLIRQSELIVNEIRKILHTTWGKGEIKYLKKLQKCGVAIMKAIEERGDLSDTLNSVRAEIEKITEKMGVPINHMATPPKENAAKTPKVPQEASQPEMPPDMAQPQQPMPQQPMPQQSMPQQSMPQAPN